ncbi:bifunctional Dynamin/P-loop containing nucleoside triphosphate hydrolase/Dynamin [Babesia duncani]|uniref:Bifunctional Dynamin/P-loop containing nucleoside triphosphate hydrolase/Dynamin n=1 Tax=Babesia duncani TaxID=323732 RepID=A0AAD9PIK0_9APIC|nr:bifunctional Dynamin/P-loop containing nucleoside triphosphate hydrolase/Dynamin [Babesia duncani]
MEQLIPLISRLQSILAWTGESTVDLPTIAVVGAQSVGKSSVLEAIVGLSFLPKGSGIVTQRPLILQLRHEAGTKEYAEFGHQRGHIYDDFQKVKDEIKAETERLVGNTKNVSPIPIFLKVSSPRVVDLTLVDLPGITKVPVGDQNQDIENQIRQMILEYISKPSCVILALSAANTDIATSDSLKLAREVDPSGARTIGVITKCDMLDEGVNALDLLQGKIYRLKRGYVGVVCRDKSNADGGHNSIEEEAFFQNHPVYSPIAKKCGIRYLATILHEMLSCHIKEMLPYVKSKILALLHEKETELVTYGFNSELSATPGACLLHYFTKFSQRFKDLIDGKISPRQHSSQLFGGARIYFIFNDSYLKTLKTFSPLSGLTDIEIRTAIRNSTGPCSALFVPEIAFSNLVKKQIKLLESPSLQCVDQVYEELQNILASCEVPEINRYVNMRTKIMSVVKDLLRQCVEPTKDMIRNMIQIELAYINTNHPDFLKNAPLESQSQSPESENKQTKLMPKQSTDNQKGPMSRSATPKATIQSAIGDATKTLWLPNIPKVVTLGNDPSEREIVEAELIKTLIESYFSIVR